ncbi:cell division protein ZapA [Xinfangfangia sp. D13-10-4-6]|nr:cell division protein ZapA [Pseudogemmobacter hezensis]
MPDIEVTIGGRGFLVACQPGEEHFLRSAAAQLDLEAQPLIASMGRMPEVRMLLMAGLMLADRTAALDDEMRQLREKIAALEARPTPEPVRIEVPVIPPQVPETFAELSARIEAIAERIEEKASGPKALVLGPETVSGPENASGPERTSGPVKTGPENLKPEDSGSGNKSGSEDKSAPPKMSGADLPGVSQPVGTDTPSAISPKAMSAALADDLAENAGVSALYSDVTDFAEDRSAEAGADLAGDSDSKPFSFADDPVPEGPVSEEAGPEDAAESSAKPAPLARAPGGGD